jgi:predicted ArsR family transcriptional regulator
MPEHARHDIASALYYDGPASVAQLAESLRLRPATVRAALIRMEVHEIVCREGRPASWRLTDYGLTQWQSYEANPGLPHSSYPPS